MESTVEASVWAVLAAFAVRFPLFLVWAVAALAAITRWRMLPKQALLTLVATALVTVDMLLGTYVGWRLPSWTVPRWGIEEYSVAYQVLAFLRSAVQAVAWALLAYAALGRIVRPFEKDSDLGGR